MVQRVNDGSKWPAFEKIITHRFNFTEFQEGFDVMRSGKSGKVILNWES